MNQFETNISLSLYASQLVPTADATDCHFAENNFLCAFLGTILLNLEPRAAIEPVQRAATWNPHYFETILY